MTRETIRQAVNLLAQAASPTKIILFGSHARGQAREESDLDFLVLENKVSNRRAEIVRLLRILEPYDIPADIFVASEEFYEQWKDAPGTILFEAAREGQVMYESR